MNENSLERKASNKKIDEEFSQFFFLKSSYEIFFPLFSLGSL